MNRTILSNLCCAALLAATIVASGAGLGLAEPPTKDAPEFLKAFHRKKQKQIDELAKQCANEIAKLKEAMLADDGDAAMLHRSNALNFKHQVALTYESTIATRRLAPHQMQVDQIGIIPDSLVKIMQVTNKEKGECLGIWYGDKITKLRGLDLSSSVDGDRLKFPPEAAFIVTGTQTYETVKGGSNTVFVLDMVNDKDTIRAREPLIRVQPDFTPEEQSRINEFARIRMAAAAAALEKRLAAEDLANKTELKKKREATAWGKLSVAKQLLKIKKTDAGNKRLMDVITDFGDTEAASEARQLLRQP